MNSQRQTTTGNDSPAVSPPPPCRTARGSASDFASRTTGNEGTALFRERNSVIDEPAICRHSTVHVNISVSVRVAYLQQYPFPHPRLRQRAFFLHLSQTRFRMFALYFLTLFIQAGWITVRRVGITRRTLYSVNRGGMWW